MITSERIYSDYTIVHGSDRYTPDARYRAMVAHCHFVGDTTSRINSIVHAAAEAGIDQITVTDHDTTRAQDQVREIVSTHGYTTEVVPGIEVTAVGPGNEPRHVLVYGVEEAPPAGLSPVELNVWAHKQGPDVMTAAAHPELLGFSVRQQELAAIQADVDPSARFDLGEITNGAVAGLDAWRDVHPRLSHVLRERMPPPGTNDRMEQIVFAQTDISPIGGSDAHESAGVATVVNLVPDGMTLFDAALQRKLVIIQKKKGQIAPPSLVSIGVGFVRGRILNRQLGKAWKQAGVL
jgi:hypothetical protein